MTITASTAPTQAMMAQVGTSAPASCHSISSSIRSSVSL